MGVVKEEEGLWFTQNDGKTIIFVKCEKCKHNIPPPINDCAKHKESGAMVGELVKCRSITGLIHHTDYYETISPEKISSWKKWWH